MYYIRNGLNLKWLAAIFALFGALAAFGIGNMAQANSVAAVLEANFGVNKLISGIVIAAATAAVVLGDLKESSRLLKNSFRSWQHFMSLEAS